MRHFRPPSVLAAFALLLVLTSASSAQQQQLASRTWSVDGTDRTALLSIPESAKTSPAPVVFVFHGHGGNSRNAARQFRLHTLWPEAIVVYPQGLPGPGGGLTDPEGKRPGWQVSAGQQNDRDLAFFDAMLKSLRADYKIDDAKTFATGHSNGGAFTYLLWAQRGDALAAVAPSGAYTGPRNFTKLKPKPVLHIAGEADPLVKFNLQKAMIDRDIKVNGVPSDGTKLSDTLTRHGPKDHPTPVVTYIHPGGHEFPRAAPDAIVDFFKAQKRATTQPAHAE